MINVAPMISADIFYKSIYTKKEQQKSGMIICTLERNIIDKLKQIKNDSNPEYGQTIRVFTK